MTDKPIICFGQQPCGIFPKRFFVAKVHTARKLQQELGGRIVFFYHDADSDYRETVTVMRDKQSGELARLNFIATSKVQKKYTPFYLKKIPDTWKDEIKRQLPRFVDQELAGIIYDTDEQTVADFCLAVYTKLGLMDGIEVVRSGDKDIRARASELEDDYFADVLYEGEMVRARVQGGKIRLARGGGQFIDLPDQEIIKQQKSPPARKRFEWMQSVIHCTHYVMGEGERQYMDTDAHPEVEFIDRDTIEDHNLAWLSKELSS